MECVNNDIRCRTRGCCSCHHDYTAEASSGCAELLIFLILGTVISFLYPAVRIARSPWKFDGDGVSQFTGTVWLFVSPLFGMLSNMLFQIIFATGACSLGALETKITSSIYTSSIFLIYFLAISLALVTFLIKNRKTIKLFATEIETRTTRNIFILAGTAVMAVLAVLSGSGAILAGTNSVYTLQKENQLENQKNEQLIALERAKFDQLVGKYKLITRKDPTLFLIAKSSDGKNLRLNSLDSDSGKQAGNMGCLLSPEIKNGSVYYAISECFVDGKISPLSKIYFEVKKDKLIMTFSYNGNSFDDTLEKLK